MHANYNKQAQAVNFPSVLSFKSRVPVGKQRHSWLYEYLELVLMLPFWM
jgi:hypothetical protein